MSELDLKMGDTPPTTEPPATDPENPEVEDGCLPNDECPPVGCVYVFISAIPGSQVVINGKKDRDGLKRDVGTICFAPVGERKPHPIIDGAMYTDFGMYVTDDPKVAWVLNQSIAKGNAQYFHYCENDPAHVAMFQPEVYSIATPGNGADITLQ